MAIASAVVVPLKREYEDLLKERLTSVEGVEVHDIGEKGIAVVLEAGDASELKRLSEKISGWEEVIEFQLVYLNWEEVK